MVEITKEFEMLDTGMRDAGNKKTLRKCNLWNNLSFMHKNACKAVAYHLGPMSQLEPVSNYSAFAKIKPKILTTCTFLVIEKILCLR